MTKEPETELLTTIIINNSLVFERLSVVYLDRTMRKVTKEIFSLLCNALSCSVLAKMTPT